MTKMKRIDKILNHDLFIENIDKTITAETHRRFCRHGMEHLLDVARIAYIMNTQSETMLDMEIIYAAALLHDIGRGKSYETGEEHDELSVKIARVILKDCDFSAEETELIADAITGHRDKSVSNENPNSLSYILNKADKLSRPCYCCDAYEECNWPENLKNKSIVF